MLISSMIRPYWLTFMGADAVLRFGSAALFLPTGVICRPVGFSFLLFYHIIVGLQELRHHPQAQ